MGRIMFGVHKTKIHNTLLPWNYPTEIFAQGGQRDICKNVQYSIIQRKKLEKNLYPNISKYLNKSWYVVLRQIYKNRYEKIWP